LLAVNIINTYNSKVAWRLCLRGYIASFTTQIIDTAWFLTSDVFTLSLEKVVRYAACFVPNIELNVQECDATKAQ
jgi:hypothetical protein